MSNAEFENIKNKKENMLNVKTFEKEIFGKKIIIETGKLAKQSDGSVTVRLGDSIVLVTVVASKDKKEGVDFLPLTVDVEERMYAAAKIPGGFIKREGRPSEKSILTARLIDRPLRPSFPEGYTYETQVISTILTVDQKNPFDILALNGASTALMISDIPFNGPVAAVRIGHVGGKFIVNPTLVEIDQSDIDLIIAGNKDAVLMIEAAASEVSEEDAIEAISVARKAISELVDFQLEITKAVGKEKREVELFTIPEEITKKVRDSVEKEIAQAITETEKGARDKKLEEVREKAITELIVEGSASDLSDETLVKSDEATADKEENAELETFVKAALRKIEKELVRKQILEKNQRLDGRKADEIRPITAEAGMLPRTRIHGSGLFTRGQTQALTVLTLGTVGEEQMLDGLGIEASKRYIHHYNFPPFSIGETGFMRGPKRREIGHGSLAEKALSPVIPDEEKFPYTIRLVSDILESNGSTSMASVCGSTLALMDAGVPIAKPVSGIAMGLIKESKGVAILSDILGAEDALGDMDFKVAGTKDGITAIQMDMKITGIDNKVLKNALDQAKKGRLFILDKITDEIASPREELSEYAPRVLTVKINPEKIGDVIGPGGKVIKGITEETGATIDIEQNGTVFISSKDAEGANKAKKMVEDIVKEVQKGEEYEGTVTKTTSFGAFVQILPGKEGLVHVSKLADGFVKDVEEIVKVGDKIKVKVLDIDRQGKISLKRIE